MCNNHDMNTVKLAFDRSARTMDADGRLHVARSHISKSAVNPYYGSEIPGYEALGLEPTKIYRLLRDPVELERSVDTFARMPILSKHVHVTADDPQPELVVGAVGSEVSFAPPYLDADLCIWDSKAIAGIEADAVRELSCAYRYIAVMEPGEYEGQTYDGRMTEIQGSHLALVEVGRAGSDVVVADANPFSTTKEKPAMKMTKLGAALFAAFSAASPVLAADSALPALVGQANRKNFPKADIRAKLLALDATLNPQQLDNVIDALLDVEQEPEAVEPPNVAEDETPAEKLRSLLAGKCDDATIEAALALLPADVASDEEPGMKPEEVKTAMDSLRRDLLEAEEARRAVRHVVGEVLGMDSAEAIYGFALDNMKVARKGVSGAPALRAIFDAASKAEVKQTPQFAMDAAGVAEQFPGAARFL